MFLQKDVNVIFLYKKLPCRLSCVICCQFIYKAFLQCYKVSKEDLGIETRVHLSFGSPVVKIYPFVTLCWVNKDEKMYSNKFFHHRTIYFLQLLKINLLSEIIVSQAQPTFICSNSAVIKVEKSVKYVQS